VLAVGYGWLSIAKPFDAATEPRVRAASKVLISVDPAKVARIAELLPDGSAFALAKGADGFAFEKRPGIGLSANRILAALYALTSLEATDTVDADPQRPADFGLDKPGLVTISLEDASSQALEIGSKGPGGDYYVRLPGSTVVYLAPGLAVENFYGRPDDFRERKLPVVDLQKLALLRILRADLRLEIADLPDRYDPLYQTSILVLKPFRHAYPAGPDSLKVFLKSLPPAFTIQDFVDEPGSLASLGLDPPLVDLELGDGNARLRLLIGKDASPTTLYARLFDKPGIFTLLKTDLAFVYKADAFQLINHLPLLIPIEKVSALEFRYKDLGLDFKLDRRELPPAKDAKSGSSKNYATSYRLGDRTIAEATFRNIYQWIVGIAIEGANPKAIDAPRLPKEATVVFHLNAGLSPRSFGFVPVSDDFYALAYDGDAEFLVTKSQMEGLSRRISQALGAGP
ncbi:MAG: DUF4340 domain-containing protein, partial [Rectinemataceae bacterium]